MIKEAHASEFGKIYTKSLNLQKKKNCKYAKVNAKVKS